MNPLLNDRFHNALIDYQYLVEKGYPRKEINRIVGNRYDLSRTHRSAMLRGIASKKEIRSRKQKIVKSIKNKVVCIDGFNVLYTIANYLHGRFVFIANDGFLRDTGEVTGKNLSTPLFNKAIELLLEVLLNVKVKSFRVYFDYPVSHSGDISKQMNEQIKLLHLKGESKTVKSPDSELKKLKDGIVATSDSAILDLTKTKIFDLAGYVLKIKYNPEFIDLRELLV